MYALSGITQTITFVTPKVKAVLYDVELVKVVGDFSLLVEDLADTNIIGGSHYSSLHYSSLHYSAGIIATDAACYNYGTLEVPTGQLQGGEYDIHIAASSDGRFIATHRAVYSGLNNDVVGDITNPYLHTLKPK